MAEEWEEVCRRKQTTNGGHLSHLTNIYVAGFHGGTKKSELWSLFSKHGHVADVYMGNKRDNKKMNFAFVRFKGVGDEKELEDKLQGTTLKERPLIINLSRHPRKSPNLQQTHLKRNIVRVAPPPLKSGIRDGRSFAHVASGRENNIQMSPITINSATVMNEWLKKADQHEIPYERTAWLKILGVPLRLWDEENFNIIDGRFGRIVSPFNKLYTRRDFSMEKVSVLTSERKWINTEVTVVADGKTYKIGVVEYTDDWSPFLPAPFDKVDEESGEEGEEVVDDSSENDEEEDGISDTWMGDQYDDTEEGEIRSEPSRINSPVRHESDAGGWTKDFTPSIMGKKETIIDNSQSGDTPNGEKTIGIPKKTTDGTVLKALTPPKSFKFQSKTADKCNTDHVPIGSTSPLTHGRLENLVPSGCFGPFPCLNPNIVGPPAKKRKRSDVDAVNILDLIFSPPAKQVDVLHHSENTIAGVPMTHTTNPPDHTSNLVSDNPSVPTKDRRDHVDCSKPNEYAQIAEIGALVGSQIEADNNILASVVGEKGVHDCYP
ncbi:unnamed protein product [Lactuca virosa]|uniref:RRM domain-containing protein n=1 Tax=Lactuca virosa TaxID=75947 RepID=A0AAU9LHF9_9ASTR|nr:unnamed protein product [Lactuca virosa]